MTLAPGEKTHLTNNLLFLHVGQGADTASKTAKKYSYYDKLCRALHLTVCVCVCVWICVCVCVSENASVCWSVCHMGESPSWRIDWGCIDLVEGDSGVGVGGDENQ